MPFPAIKHCIVADSVRDESRGKLSILGYFGVAPDVKVVVSDLTGVVELSFLFVGVGGDGTHQVSFDLLDPTGKSLIPKMPSFPVKPELGKNTNLIFQITTKLGMVGTHTIVLLVNGNPQYRNTFAVATPP